MHRLGVFVDAGYFWCQTITVIHGRMTERGRVALNYKELRRQLLNTAAEEFPHASLLRAYWYDGPGNHGKAEEHARIEELDDFKLRLGTRNSTGRQKGVDGLIIADIISLTQNGAISDALLITGDADLAPGIDAAQNLGLRVHLLTLGPSNATSPHLAAEVDRKRSWSDDIVRSFASPQHFPLAREISPAPHNGARNGAPTGPSTPSVPSTPRPEAAPRPDLPEDEDAKIELIAKTFVDQCSPRDVYQIQSGSGWEIPHEIDRELLRHSRTVLGDYLDHYQKYELRNRVKKIANDRPTITADNIGNVAPPEEFAFSDETDDTCEANETNETT